MNIRYQRVHIAYQGIQIGTTAAGIEAMTQSCYWMNLPSLG